MSNSNLGKQKIRNSNDQLLAILCVGCLLFVVSNLIGYSSLFKTENEYSIYLRTNNLVSKWITQGTPKPSVHINNRNQFIERTSTILTPLSFHAWENTLRINPTERWLFQDLLIETYTGDNLKYKSEDNNLAFLQSAITSQNTSSEEETASTTIVLAASTPQVHFMDPLETLVDISKRLRLSNKFSAKQSRHFNSEAVNNYAAYNSSNDITNSTNSTDSTTSTENRNGNVLRKQKLIDSEPFKSVLERIAMEIFLFHVDGNSATFLLGSGYGVTYWVNVGPSSQQKHRFHFDHSQTLCPDNQQPSVNSAHEEGDRESIDRDGNEPESFLCRPPDLTTITYISDFGQPTVVFDATVTDPFFKAENSMDTSSVSRTFSAAKRPTAALISYPVFGKHLSFPGSLLRAEHVQELEVKILPHGIEDVMTIPRKSNNIVSHNSTLFAKSLNKFVVSSVDSKHASLRGSALNIDPIVHREPEVEIPAIAVGISTVVSNSSLELISKTVPRHILTPTIEHEEEKHTVNVVDSNNHRVDFVDGSGNSSRTLELDLNETKMSPKPVVLLSNESRQYLGTVSREIRELIENSQTIENEFESNSNRKKFSLINQRRRLTENEKSAVGDAAAVRTPRLRGGLAAIDDDEVDKNNRVKLGILYVEPTNRPANQRKGTEELPATSITSIVKDGYIYETNTTELETSAEQNESNVNLSWRNQIINYFASLASHDASAHYQELATHEAQISIVVNIWFGNNTKQGFDSSRISKIDQPKSFLNSLRYINKNRLFSGQFGHYEGQKSNIDTVAVPVELTDVGRQPATPDSPSWQTRKGIAFVSEDNSHSLITAYTHHINITSTTIHDGYVRGVETPQNDTHKFIRLREHIPGWTQYIPTAEIFPWVELHQSSLIDRETSSKYDVIQPQIRGLVENSLFDKIKSRWSNLLRRIFPGVEASTDPLTAASRGGLSAFDGRNQLEMPGIVRKPDYNLKSKSSAPQIVKLESELKAASLHPLEHRQKAELGTSDSNVQGTINILPQVSSLVNGAHTFYIQYFPES